MAIDTSWIDIDLQEHERWHRTLRIRVPADVVRGEGEQAMERLIRQLRVPGYRQGKVPAWVVERQYGPALQRELLDRIIPEAYRAALAVPGIQPISEGAIEDVEDRPEDGLTFRVSFDVHPEVDLPVLEGFRVERLREEHAVWLPPEPGRRRAGCACGRTPATADATSSCWGRAKPFPPWRRRSAASRSARRGTSS